MKSQMKHASGDRIDAESMAIAQRENGEIRLRTISLREYSPFPMG